MGHIAVLIPLFGDKPQTVPVAVRHTVFGGNKLLGFQAFGKRSHVQKRQHQRTVFRRHLLIARLFKFYRCAALVAGQAMEFIIAGNFLIKVLLQVDAVDGLVTLADGRDDLVFQFCLIQCPLQLFLLGFFFFYNIINEAEAQQCAKSALLGVHPDGLPVKEFMPVAVRHAGVVEIRSFCVLQAGFHMGAGELLGKFLPFVLGQVGLAIHSCKVVKCLTFFLLFAQQASRVGFFGNL